MNLIHRHIFVNVLMTCAGAVAVLVFVLAIGNALKDLIGYVTAGQLPFDTFVRLVALSLPVLVSYALPMGMLTGILLVLGRMSSEHEITALRASGLSVAWLSAPIIFLALCGMALSVLINFEFMPRAKVEYEAGLREAVRQNPMSVIVPKTFIRYFPGHVIYVGSRHGEVLEDIWIWELDKQNRVLKFGRASSGKFGFDDVNNNLVITLNNMQAEVHDARDPEDMSKVHSGGGSDQATFNLPLSKLTGRELVNIKPAWLTFEQLIAEWRRLNLPDPVVPAATRALKQMRMQITMHEKFSMAFSVLSLSLLAIPLGIKVSRKETSANLGIGLALALSYYFCTIAVGWLDNYPALRPDLLMWLPNFGFQALGMWMFYRVDRAA